MCIIISSQSHHIIFYMLYSFFICYILISGSAQKVRQNWRRGILGPLRRFRRKFFAPIFAPIGIGALIGTAMNNRHSCSAAATSNHQWLSLLACRSNKKAERSKTSCHHLSTAKTKVTVVAKRVFVVHRRLGCIVFQPRPNW
jgi:hypothetical protein